MRPVGSLNREMVQRKENTSSAWMIQGLRTQTLSQDLCDFNIRTRRRRLGCEDLERYEFVFCCIPREPDGGKTAVAEFVEDVVAVVCEGVVEMDGVEAAGAVGFDVFDVGEGGGVVGVGVGVGSCLYCSGVAVVKGFES